MATIRRIGFGTVFELEDSKVGIGTDAATHTLQAPVSYTHLTLPTTPYV